jgi:hypothetical protein
MAALKSVNRFSERRLSFFSLNRVKTIAATPVSPPLKSQPTNRRADSDDSCRPWGP